MTNLMSSVFDIVAETNSAGRWHRAEHPGQRVTLAALERRGYLVRRPFRGDGISRDSAFEYACRGCCRETLKPSVYTPNDRR